MLDRFGVQIRQTRMHTVTAPPTAESEFLRQFLRGRDIDCPGCGYNLRDLTGERCPECGQDIVLHLQLAEPRQAPLLTGLIGLSAGVGLNGLLVIYYVIVRFWMRFGTPDPRFMWTILVGLAVHAVALAAWLRMWRRIRRIAAAPRWLFAVACCLLPVVDIVFFSVTIR